MGNARFCEGVPQTVMFVPMLAILFDGRCAGERSAKTKATGILPNLLYTTQLQDSRLSLWSTLESLHSSDQRVIGRPAMAWLAS